MHPAASGAPWFRLSNKESIQVSKTVDDGTVPVMKGNVMRGVPWYYDPSRAPSKKPHSPSFAPTVKSPPTEAPWFGMEMKSKEPSENHESKEEEKTMSTTDADADGEGHQLFGHTGKVQPIQSPPPPQQQQQQSTADNTQTADQDTVKITIGKETADQRAYFESMMALKNSHILQSTSEIHVQSDKKMDHDELAPWNDPTLPTTSPVSSPTDASETRIPSSAPWFHTRIKITKDDKDIEDYDKDKKSKELPPQEGEKEEKASLQNSKETLQSLGEKLQDLQKTQKNNEKKLRGS